MLQTLQFPPDHNTRAGAFHPNGREIVIGAHSPSMKFVNDEAEIADVVRMINESGATTLIVGAMLAGWESLP